jgi:hypothetical protein
LQLGCVLGWDLTIDLIRNNDNCGKLLKGSSIELFDDLLVTACRSGNEPLVVALLEKAPNDSFRRWNARKSAAHFDMERALRMMPF